MKFPHICILAVILCQTPLIERASAEPLNSVQKIEITLKGVRTHQQYQYARDELKKITGVSGLIPYKESNGTIVLTGYLSSDPAMFKNDVQAFATDRFKVDIKSSSEEIEVILKQL